MICDTGDDLKNQFKANASLSAKYLTMSGKLSADTALDARYQSTSMFALILDNYDAYVATLNMTKTFPQYMNPEFLMGLQALPNSFDQSQESLSKPFLDFFERWGTHIITSVTYGQRFVIEVQETTSDQEIKKNFKANINAAYKNVLTEAHFDAGIEASQEFIRFQNDKHERVIIQGGDAQQHGALKASPLSRDAFIAWSASRANPGAEKALVINMEPFADMLARFGVGANADLNPKLVAMNAALQYRHSYRWMCSVPAEIAGSEGAPQVLLITSNSNCTVTLEFQDPLCVIRPSLRNAHSRTAFGFSISADRRSITYRGTANEDDGNPFFGPNAHFHFDLYCGPSTNVKMTRSDTKVGVKFRNGPYTLSQKAYGWGFGKGETGTEMAGVGLNLQEGAGWIGLPW